MVPNRFKRQNQKEPATSRHCRFIGKPGLQPFGGNRFGSADRHHAATVGQIQRKRQRKGEINFAVPILQGRLPAVYGKKGIRAKQGKYIFMSAFNFAPRKRLMKIRQKIVFAVIKQNQCVGRCLQQIRLLHDPIFHGSIKIHITLTGFPVCFSFSDGLYMQRPSESLIFRHRDETEWGRESCLNHKHQSR